MILSLLLLTLPPGHLVQLNPEQIYAWGLPTSVDNRYKVFSFNEFKDIRIAELQLAQFGQENLLLKNKLKETEDMLSSFKLELNASKEIGGVLKLQGDRRLEELEGCMKELKEEKESIFPIVALSAGGTLAVVGIILISIASSN